MPKKKIVDPIQKDREFIDQGLNWPRYPILPMKRRDGQYERSDYCGFIFGYMEPEPILYIGNIWKLNDIHAEIHKEGKQKVTWKEVLDRFERITFSSLDELVLVYKID